MRHRPSAAALIAGVLLVGCTAVSGDEQSAEGERNGDVEARVVQPGAPGDSGRDLSAEELADLDLETGHTAADARFMQEMIAHHVQALEMTELVPERTSREDVPLFAERMDLSQQDEIELMQRWLEARDEHVPDPLEGHGHAHEGHDGHAHGDDGLMPGMLTEDELAELEAASGEAFDRLFLESMIYHHLGAIEMVEDLYAEGGGSELEIQRFADHVVSDQQIEINRAQEMLVELDGQG